MKNPFYGSTDSEAGLESTIQISEEKKQESNPTRYRTIMMIVLISIALIGTTLLISSSNLNGSMMTTSVGGHTPSAGIVSNAWNSWKSQSDGMF
jgi:hypothetical protein